MFRNVRSLFFFFFVVSYVPNNDEGFSLRQSSLLIESNKISAGKSSIKDFFSAVSSRNVTQKKIN
jgi:hypothetical protein